MSARYIKRVNATSFEAMQPLCEEDKGSLVYTCMNATSSDRKAEGGGGGGVGEGGREREVEISI